jgi:hypothetical protein
VNDPAANSNAHERNILLLLCLLAAAHVFVFSAAFPFFNVVDEQTHFDLVVRYSHAEPPRSLGHACDEALPYLVLFGTPEYIYAPESFAGGKIPPPPWTQPLKEIPNRLLTIEYLWKNKLQNHEASQPPLYYTLAGAWWRLGKLLGFADGRLLYWLRFLNVPLVMAMVVLSWFCARQVFPQNQFIRVAVAALMAFLPQSVFYGINNDVLAPLTFGAAFVLLLKLWDAAQISPRLAVATGLALAATFLTKISNLPLLAAAGLFIALKMFRFARGGKLHSSVPALAVLAACAGLPMAAWMAWCQINFGDFTGSVLKIKFLGWTNKPFAEWFHHPLFTVPGFWYFLKGNLATFWQGEMLWRLKPLAIPAVDDVYVVVTLCLLAAACFNALRPRPFSSSQRAALGFGILCLLAMFAFFALLSVKYDFHDCFNPSRAHPFFVSGRLMLGMLVPFLILCAAGLDRLLAALRPAFKYAVLAAFIMFMLASEITIDWPVFPNAYNWFHM